MKQPTCAEEKRAKEWITKHGRMRNTPYYFAFSQKRFYSYDQVVDMLVFYRRMGKLKP